MSGLASRLAVLATTTRTLRDAEARAAAIRRDQHAQIVRLARDRAPYGDIAIAAGISDQAVGKIARAAGVRRYRPSTPAARPSEPP